MLKVFQVFREAQTITGGTCFQSAGDRILVNRLRSIRGVYDRRQTQEPWFFQSIFEDNGLERAASIVSVTEFHTRRIEGNRTRFLGNLIQLTDRHKQEFRFIVDESGDQPWTSHAINMDVRASDPFHILLSF